MAAAAAGWVYIFHVGTAKVRTLLAFKSIALPPTGMASITSSGYCSLTVLRSLLNQQVCKCAFVLPGMESWTTQGTWNANVEQVCKPARMA